MTKSENIDKIDNAENITVTSDGAFERVTSDIKMEESEDKGYLQQNTAGLVQEIPNISFLDISDALIKSKKTLYGRNNRNVVVGNEGRTIEVIPTDILILSGGDEHEDYLGDYENFPITSASGLNWDSDNCFELVSQPSYAYIKINRAGYYSFKYTGVIHSTAVSNLESNTLICGFNIELIDGTTFIASKQIYSAGYRYYESIHNEYISYCMKGEKIGVYINRNTGPWQMYNINIYAQYLSDTK